MATKRPIELNDYLTEAAAADVLGIARMTVWRWTNAGKLQPIIVGGHRMILRSEVDRLKREMEEAAAEEKEKE